MHTSRVSRRHDWSYAIRTDRYMPSGGNQKAPEYTDSPSHPASREARPKDLAVPVHPRILQARSLWWLPGESQPGVFRRYSDAPYGRTSRRPALAAKFGMGIQIL